MRNYSSKCIKGSSTTRNQEKKRKKAKRNFR